MVDDYCYYCSLFIAAVMDVAVSTVIYCGSFGWLLIVNFVAVNDFGCCGHLVLLWSFMAAARQGKG